MHLQIKSCRRGAKRLHRVPHWNRATNIDSEFDCFVIIKTNFSKRSESTPKRRRIFREEINLKIQKMHESFPYKNHCVTKSSHQDCGPCYLHLPIFFLYIHSPLLLENKNLSRSMFSSVNKTTDQHLTVYITRLF